MNPWNFIFLALIFGIRISYVSAQAGGETCAQATVIPSIPFTGQGSTTGAVDDYFESCPDVSNQGGAPDHVYTFTNGNAPQIVDVSLCEAVTNYDSQLYIYEGFCGGPLIGCQEDGCQSPAYFSAYNSVITSILLQPNTTYFFIVDGYGGNSDGNYQLDISLGTGTPPDSSELPLVYIETNNQLIPDEPKISGEMRIIYNGVGNINYATDPYNEYDGAIGIEQRGSSSSMFPKKGYGLETRDSVGFNNNVSLFGMPAENDWVLHAPYSDKSLMRNELSYYMGEQFEGYSPRTQHCEVILNGIYQGVYLFVEKIKRDPGRVNISELTSNETTGDDVTGGYIIKIDKLSGSNSNYWTSQYQTVSSNPQAIQILYHYPKADSIVPEQEQYIQSYVNNFEYLLDDANFQDPQTGYRTVADVNSFVDYLILTEAVKNVDGYRISTFLYKDKDSGFGKLRIGPPWDYNLALGNSNYCQGGPATGWAYDFNSVCAGDQWQIPFWWDKFMSDSDFTKRVRCRWNQLRQGPFHTDSLFAHIDETAALINNAQERNFERWDILGNYVWPNNFIGNTFQEEVEYLKDWIDERMIWMDNNLPSTGNCDFAELEEVEEINLSIFPNPASSNFYIEYPSSGSPSQVSIRDINGRQIWTNSFDPISLNTINSASIPELQELSSGVYFVSVRTSDQEVVKKLVLNN